MIDYLKNEVEIRFGKKIAYQKDCKLLSSSILGSTGSYLSPATLRRFFGLLLTNSNPSVVTLDILSRYAGYKSWQDFNHFALKSSDHNQLKADVWEKGVLRSKKISLNTVEVISKRSGIDFYKTISRVSVNESINYFIESENNFTAIVGPGGYGKSIFLAHWYIQHHSKKRQDNDIVLFINTLEKLSKANTGFGNLIDQILGFSLEEGFLSRIFTHSSKLQGRFILIIDGLDELSSFPVKLENIFKSIAEFTRLIPENPNIKLILSMRFTTWESFKSFIPTFDRWFNVNANYFNHENANIPPLRMKEIQQIFDNTINKKFSSRTLIDELNVELRDLLTYPYFLQLFTNIFQPDEEYLYSDHIEVMREFLKKQVYFSQYADEKVDILIKTIELSDYGKNPNALKKNRLKEVYPIHLKKAGNYYSAYQDLLSFGIINEEMVEVANGGFCRFIRFSNPHLYHILIVQYLIQKRGKISFELFVEIESKFQHHEFLVPLLTLTYQIAYKDRIFEPLLSFFELKNDTIDKAFSSPAIPITLRKDEYLRNILIPVYCKNKLARKYLFDDFQDINYLAKGYDSSLQLFKKEILNDEESLLANTLLTYGGFLTLNKTSVEQYYKQIKDIKPTPELNYSLVGRWFACMNLYESAIYGSNSNQFANDAIQYLNEFESRKDYRLGTFENAFFPSLILSKQLNLFLQLDKYFEKLGNTKPSIYNYNILIYRYLFMIIKGEKVLEKDVFEIEKYFHLLNPMDNLHAKIFGLVVRAFFFLNRNDLEKAYENLRYGIELSSNYGYKLFEVKLLKILSANLRKFGENNKANEFKSLAEGIVAKSGFSYELL